MILAFVLILVGIASWYIVFVMFGEWWRRDRPSSTLTAVPMQPPEPIRTDSVYALSLGWTALDDQQLTRLLKGSAP